MKSRALIIPRSGTETDKSNKLPTKVSNAATANNTRRNQTSDAAETAVLAAVGVKPEEFSDSRCIASAFRCVSASSSARYTSRPVFHSVGFLATGAPAICAKSILGRRNWASVSRINARTAIDYTAHVGPRSLELFRQ